MIKKHYGKWIPKGSQKMANRVSEMLGFTKDTEGEQNGDFAQLLPSFCPDATKGTSKILIPFVLIDRGLRLNHVNF